MHAIHLHIARVSGEFEADSWAGARSALLIVLPPFSK
mgnify:CR=1 FL=1